MGNLFEEFVTATGVCATAGAMTGGTMFPGAGALPGAILGAELFDVCDICFISLSHKELLQIPLLLTCSLLII